MLRLRHKKGIVMAGNVCDICKKAAPRIHIKGVGEFCLDCYNKWALEKYDGEDTYQYAKTISVIEPGGAHHTFEIEHMIMGELVSWEAREVGGGYKFRETSYIDENGAKVASRFFKKIVKGVCTKSLEISDYPASNLVYRDGKSYRLKEKGLVHIEEDEEDYFRLAFFVDGMKFSEEEFVKLFGAAPGFDLHYQIHDASDDLPGEHDYSVYERITKDGVLKEFHTLVSEYCSEGHITSDNAFNLSYELEEIKSRIRVLVEAGDRDVAVEIAGEIINTLKGIKCEDDIFPYGDMAAICRIVDPYRTNPELWGPLFGDEG